MTATTDESMATKVEDYLVTQIKALTVGATPLGELALVEAMPGTEAKNVRAYVESVLQRAEFYAGVMFVGDVGREQAEGALDLEPTYAILTARRNERPGCGRRGDGRTIGINKVRDLYYGLHDLAPGITVAGKYAERVEYRATDLVFEQANTWCTWTTVVVREVPAAA